MALNLDVGVGDAIMIGGSKVTMLHKTGRKARLSIDASPDINVSLEKAPPDLAHKAGFGSEKKDVPA